MATIRRCVAAQGRARVAFSGGRTPQRLHALLAEPPYRDQVAWGALEVCFADERCVPPEDAASNYQALRHALLRRVPLAAAQIHRVPLALGEPRRIAQAYEEDLRALFGLPEPAWPAFDLIILGLGHDGHTASLFPDSPALHERRRWVADAVGPAPHPHRITLTLPVLNHAQQLLWLVSGREKAAAVRAIFALAESPALPATLIAPGPGASATWLMDRAAASHVPHAEGPHP